MEGALSFFICLRNLVFLSSACADDWMNARYFLLAFEFGVVAAAVCLIQSMILMCTSRASSARLFVLFLAPLLVPFGNKD